jgi:serine/threonine protein kinase
MHHDVNPDNILITSLVPIRIKLFDFGALEVLSLPMLG